MSYDEAPHPPTLGGCIIKTRPFVLHFNQNLKQFLNEISETRYGQKYQLKLIFQVSGQ